MNVDRLVEWLFFGMNGNMWYDWRYVGINNDNLVSIATDWYECRWIVMICDMLI